MTMKTDDQSFEPGKPDLRPRTIVRFRNSKRFAIPNVVPTPFGPQRAQEAWEQARSLAYGWIPGRLDEVLSDGELAYVDAVWSALPNGETCWMVVFNFIRYGRIPSHAD